MAPSRTFVHPVGGTQPHADEIRRAIKADGDDSAPATLGIDRIDEGLERLAIGRYARFSRASDNLAGGTQPLADPIHTTVSDGHHADLAIGRYARFSRPSPNLVGGTQPRADTPSEQAPSPFTPQMRHPERESEFFTIRQDSPGANSFSIPKAPDRPAKARWLRPGEPLTVADITLPGGMIYTGTQNPEFRLSEPSFIDASLPVAGSDTPPVAGAAYYWSTYKDLEPAARRGYLQWLAGGRCDPEASSGYLFMFFHGLERRLLIDSLSDPDARKEIPAMKEEIERLRTVYHRDFSFCSQASRLLEYLNMPVISGQMYLREPPMESADRFEMPIVLRVALGQMAIDKYPLNASWALSWALTDPNISRGKPVGRCADLFQRLFRAEYEEQFPDGLKLLRNKTRLWVAYRPSSAYLDVPEIPVGDLPDVSITSATRKKIQVLVQGCTSVLAPFSRYMGRNADDLDKHESLEALLLLPVSLWPEYARHELRQLQSEVGTGTKLMTLDQLAIRFKSDGAQARNQIIALIKVLEDMHVGMEPDALAGNRAPKPEDSIVLFATEPDPGMSRVTVDYNVAVVTLDLASSVATVDGGTSQHAIALLEQHIDSWGHLRVAHRTRLKAYLLMQLQQPPNLASLKKKLGSLNQEEKQTIVGCLTHLAHADGAVTPEKVRLLERIYRTLQLDPHALYSNLHGAATGLQTGQASTALSATTAAGPDKKPGSGIVLDMGRVAQLRRETAEVSALLADVFRNDQEDEQQDHTQIAEDDASQDTPDTGAHLHGLDAGHSAFLRLLVSRSQWSRRELEIATAGMALMLDGALEQINDMAFEVFDMPVSEGDDPIEINPDILSELAL
ncbi:Tellurite resistance protein TerB [Pseudomonas syringae]|uniref:tellurite resistance TerB family protein n=1 Tax=Pseudomonas syringae TaxID=317 RepID=UPI000BB60082|nr:TerB N-terminal domain-containing protein [Pseudomonas syringae]PBP74600.1 Tellurite resistance protein TerB [Pseudomonas syringae]